MENNFIVRYTDTGILTLLKNKNDKDNMNWSVGTVPWGTVKAPEGIRTEKTHSFTERGTLKEEYIFINTTKFPVYLKETDLGIYISLPDSYQDAKECMKRHCHTHIWCGKEASWIKALRMSGEGPHLGMILRKGSLRNYSVQRDEKKLSNDRGSFLLHPEIDVIAPDGQFTLCMEWFWFENPADFCEQLLSYENFPVVGIKRCTYFTGETAHIEIRCKGIYEKSEIFCNGQQIPCNHTMERDIFFVKATIPVSEVGEYHLTIKINEVTTSASIFACLNLETLVERRCRFILEKQQEKQGNLRGAYLIYDNESKKRYYAHFPDDHNGGRERVGMGVLMALWLQTHSDCELEESLEQYISYVYRELYDGLTGDVFNDVCQNNDWDRLYNYPWMAVFFLEVYKWKKDEKYLLDAYRVMMRYYQKGGIEFYAIGIPAEELFRLLDKRRFEKEKTALFNQMIKQADYVKKVGLCYPKSEVNYEQSIVAPGVSILLQAYEVTGDEKYLISAKEQLNVLELFNGTQPDYHMYENAIRHWDGYWFGKYRRFGDTFPHYWSVVTGVAYEQYGRLVQEKEYLKRACESLRGCLCLFGGDGTASCAMVYPVSVNGKKGRYFDPWANDQDWALYYAWKMRSITIGDV